MIKHFLHDAFILAMGVYAGVMIHVAFNWQSYFPYHGPY